MPGEPAPPPNTNNPEASSAQAKATDAELKIFRYFSSEFETQISAQKTNALISSAFAAGVATIGIIGTAFLYRSSGLANTAVEYMKLGPVALSSLALPFPLRSYLQYRVRIPIYHGYKRLFDEAIATGTHVEPYLVEDARAALKTLQKMD